MARVNRITQFLPANAATHTTILTLPRKHSPDGTTRTSRQSAHIWYSLLLNLSTSELLKDERLGWPSWLTCSGRLTHVSGYPSAAGRAWDRKVRRSKTNVLTTVPRNQPTNLTYPFPKIAIKKPQIMCLICISKNTSSKILQNPNSYKHTPFSNITVYVKGNIGPIGEAYICRHAQNLMLLLCRSKSELDFA